MRNALKAGVILTTTSLILAGCGRKDKGDDDGSPAVEETPDATDPEQTAGADANVYDLASGCTGEEGVAMLLNATGLTLAKLDQTKQTTILATQGRLPGARSLELSTGSHVTNRLNLSAEIGETFAEAWSGDEDAAAFADVEAINALYGEFPAGDRLSYILFAKSFFERVHGGTADAEAVAAMGEMLDSLDLSTVSPTDGVTVIPPVNDIGKVVALVTAIGSTMCIY